MKLKYYMRGLGVGILITTIILSIGSKKEKLSDIEIKEKARELGMVMKEVEIDDNLQEVIDKTLDKDKQEHTLVNNEKEIPVVTEDSGSELGNDGDGIGEDGSITNTGDTEIEGNGDLDENSDLDGIETDGNVEADESSNISDMEDPESEDEGMITFTIEEGMSSLQISKLLQQKGVVDEAVDFDTYIKQKGKTEVLQYGTFTLPKDAGYEQILNTILKNH